MPKLKLDYLAHSLSLFLFFDYFAITLTTQLLFRPCLYKLVQITWHSQMCPLRDYKVLNGFFPGLRILFMCVESHFRHV